MTVMRWWRELSRRDRRALRIAAAVLLPAVVYGAILRPLRSDLMRLEQELDRERDLYRRELELRRQGPDFESVFRLSAERLLRLSPRLFGGPDPVTASADLVAYTTGLAARHRVFVQRSEPEPPAAESEGVLLLRVELRGVSDLAGVMAWVGALHRGEKLLRLTELSLIPAAIGNATGDAGLLAVTAVVEGFMLAQPDGGERLAVESGP